ncbi:MAG: hypothetical protein Q8K20_14630 [Gemmobacter sp.]|nr:hypothetical protein [Gemmobacter sp.]
MNATARHRNYGRACHRQGALLWVALALILIASAVAGQSRADANTHPHLATQTHLTHLTEAAPCCDVVGAVHAENACSVHGPCALCAVGPEGATMPAQSPACPAPGLTLLPQGRATNPAQHPPKLSASA